MNEKNLFLGCFISYPPLYYDATQQMKDLAREQGDLFKTYVWGEKGIWGILKELESENYGNDMHIILFQFYLNPIPYLQGNLKEIENYRKNEKSIGIPIIVDNSNFFNQSNEERHQFLHDSIFNKLDLLKQTIKKKKLDTNIDLLKYDLNEIFTEFGASRSNRD